MEINRRHFLCASLLATLGTSTSFMEGAHSATGIITRKDGSIEVTVGSVKSLQKIGGIALIGEVNGAPTALVRTGANKYVALDLRCTHQGVAVKPKVGGFSCEPSQGGHGSAFSQAGAVTAGPASASLNRFSVSVKGKKVVVR